MVSPPASLQAAGPPGISSRDSLPALNAMPGVQVPPPVQCVRSRCAFVVLGRWQGGTRAMARCHSGAGKVSRICGQGQPSLPAPGRLPSGKKKCAFQRTLLCCGIMDVIRLGVSFSAPGLFSGKKAGKGSLTLRWRAARPDNGRPGPSWSPARRCRRYSSGPGAVQTARSWRAGLPRC